VIKYKCILFCITYTLLLLKDASAQNNSVIQQVKDTNEVIRLLDSAGSYRFRMPDSSIFLAQKALFLARELSYVKGVCSALITVGEDYRLGGDFPQALESLFEALRISRDINNKELEASSLTFIGIAYAQLGESRQGLNYLFTSKMLFEKLALNVKDTLLARLHAYGLSNIGMAYTQMHMPDSALFFEESALALANNLPPPPFFTPKIPVGNIRNDEITPLEASILRELGNISIKLGNYNQALSYYRQVVRSDDLLNTSNAHYHIAEYFFGIKENIDSSLFYALRAYQTGRRSKQETAILDASNLLAKIYKIKDNPDSSIYYYELSMALKDSLFGSDKFHRLQALAFNEQQRQQQIIQDQENFRNKLRLYALLGIAVVFLLLTIIFYRNIRQKQKTNRALENTLKDLQSTQAQLIQSEKMASLGELTAGIAHEIQNPLNFVNNFSDVNRELIDELKSELAAGNVRSAMELTDDLKSNEEKINHHGKRADAIVKGMLQHSRASTGQKELTDINALADEYLRLAYHGLRAKDKSFNAKFESNLDKSIDKIDIVPQDLGRVLLNLINNAFYAVAEKKQQLDGNYEPTVSITTKQINYSLANDGSRIQIKVKDNGNGIPEKIANKIFQPFFTTKPTGQGTGLGLSLSHDIIKAHGGEIKVETKEGEGSEFIIQLPIQRS